MVVRDPERSVGSEDSLSAADLRSYLSSSGEQPSGEQHDWFIAINGERQGPMTADEISARLAQGEVGATDHAWRAGMSGEGRCVMSPALQRASTSPAYRWSPTRSLAVLPSHAPTLPVAEEGARTQEDASIARGADPR